MNCAYWEERISDYIENALSVSEHAAAEQHFQSCTGCSTLLADVGRLLEWRKTLPTQAAPPWLAGRIIANTPHVQRETWRDTLRQAWQWLSEPRTAMAIFTATLIIGWLGGQAGLSAQTIAEYRSPSAIYDRAQGALSGAYNAAIRAYYKSPLVATIYCRIEQLREIS